jgi:hypothetical protein
MPKLTKTLLLEALSKFDGDVVIEERGGYDTGVYFYFSGRRAPAHGIQPLFIRGLKVSHNGFCSEMVVLKRDEARCRAGIRVGLDMFWGRVAARKSTFKRWLAAAASAASHSAA